MHLKQKEYVIYVGGFLNEQIVKERNLPTRNPAGSNRMQRIADALQTNEQQVIIVSTGTCLKPKIANTFFHPERTCRLNNTHVIFSPAIGIPFLSALSAYFFLPITLFRIVSKKNVRALIIYNFSALFLLVAFASRYFARIPIFHNIEDVSTPMLSDWFPKREVRPFQQLIFSICMKGIAQLSNGLIVPSKRFLQYVAQKPNLIITGCIESTKVIDKQIDPEEGKIQILFAGKIGNEHGIDLFIETMLKIEQQSDLSSILEVNICGGGEHSAWLTKQCDKFKNLAIQYHGFVTDNEYSTLLNAADICIALQSPSGRYATSKTPSKTYEYLGNSKVVIATDVGDLSELPEEIISICTPFTSDELYKRINEFAKNRHLIPIRKSMAGKYAQQHFSSQVVGHKLRKFIKEYS